MLSRLARGSFEFVRSKVRERRNRRRIPDPAWRDACIKAGVPLDRVAVRNDGALAMRLAKATVVFPANEVARSLLRGHSFLQEMDAYTSFEFAWNKERNGLDLKWGTATYFADCYEELYILSELYLAGDYDFLPSGPCVVMDVGANVGFTSIFLADSNPDLVIEGFEPLELNLDKARTNLGANKGLEERVRFHHCGLFSSDGTLSISSEAGNRGMSSIVLDRQAIATTKVDTELVPVRRASDVVREVRARHPGRRIAMKIDCEGSEYAIFDDLCATGAISLVDFVVMEWHRLTESGSEFDGLRNLLSRCGFHTYVRGRLQTRSTVGMAVAFKACER